MRPSRLTPPTARTPEGRPQEGALASVVIRLLRYRRPVLRFLLPFASLAPVIPNESVADSWTDVNGQTFELRAVEAMGPFILFSSKPTLGRWLPAQALPLPELTRFSRAVDDHPPRSTDWASAAGALTSELRGHLQALEKQKLVPYAVDRQPEPAVIVTLYMNRHHRDTWRIMWPSMEPLADLSKRHPDILKCVLFGSNYTHREWIREIRDVPTQCLFVSANDPAQLPTLRRFIPETGYGIMVLSRDGVPLFSESNPDEDAVKALWRRISEFVGLLDERNPHAWWALAYYRTAEKLGEHPQGRVEPELIGTPIVHDSLKKLKVESIDATLRVAPDGTVAEVTDVTSDRPLAPKIEEAIAAALKMAVLVPALEDGKPVEGHYVYRFREPAVASP